MLNMRSKLILTIVVLFVTAGPAYPQRKVDPMMQLQVDMIEVKNWVKQLQSSVEANNTVVKGLVEKIADQVNTLATTMNQVTKNVDSVKTQNDGLAKQLSGNLTTLNRTVGDLQRDVSALADQVKSVSTKITNLQTTSEPLPGPDDVWRTAQTDLFTGNFALAVAGYQEFLSKYPADPRVPDAHYGMGEAFYGQKKYDQAVTAYDIVLQKFPESDKTRSALYKKGLALAEQNQPQQAIATLQEVVKRFPGTSEAQNAQFKVTELKRPPAATRKPAQ